MAAECSAADPVASARALLGAGDPQGALDALLPITSVTSPSRLSGEVSYLAGASYFHLGDYETSRPYFNTARQKGISESNLYLGRLAFLDYEFDEAEDLYSAFARSRKKSDETGLWERYEKQLEIARNAAEHVQELKVIDKLRVPYEGFYRHLALSSSAGAVLPADSIPFQKGREEALTAFANEKRDYMLWSETDSTGQYHMVESIRLTDGSWQQPAALPSMLGEGGETDYPFMRSDGTTLYFSANGDSSMGGMDLYVATRDAQTGQFLAPANLGMPFNSPYDDLMVAVDEETGICWLLSDREQLPDQLTLYVYLLEDVRTNHDSSSEEVLDHARITAIDVVPADDPVRIEKEKLIADIRAGKGKEERKVTFRFPMPGGRLYTALEDFKDPTARRAASRYQSALRKLESDLTRLASLRRSYHEALSGGKTAKVRLLSDQILNLERDVRAGRSETLELSNKAISYELHLSPDY